MTTGSHTLAIPSGDDGDLEPMMATSKFNDGYDDDEDEEEDGDENEITFYAKTWDTLNSLGRNKINLKKCYIRK